METDELFGLLMNESTALGVKTLLLFYAYCINLASQLRMAAHALYAQPGTNFLLNRVHA